MSQPLFSVVIPTHNEEHYIGKCSDTIAKAAAGYPCGTVETIVVLNRRSDKTEAIARKNASAVFGMRVRKLQTAKSLRKFDRFGDWYLIQNRTLTHAIFTGKDRKAADSFYYDIR